MKKKVTAENGVQPPLPPDLETAYQHFNPIGPRYQWEGNNGYCGEVSMISAGLYYGQYLSQYDVRTLAEADGSNQINTQLLLGINDTQVAKKLRLDAQRYEGGDSIALLKWVKNNVVSGYPVIIGVFNNEWLIYTDPDATDGDPQYDHIVPVIAWGSARPLDEEDVTGDVILLSDNGLYTPHDEVPYYYHYPIPCFLADRELANTQADPNRVYSLLKLPEPNTSNTVYAIAIKGVLDKNGETLPITVTTSRNFESPAIVNKTNARPTPHGVTLTITVSGLTPGQTYYVYYYTDEKDVPEQNFNLASGDAWEVIDAETDTWIGSMDIQSDEKAFFRAVNKNAD